MSRYFQGNARHYIGEEVQNKKIRLLKLFSTVKFLKIRTSEKKCCNYPKIGTESFYYRVMGLKDADGMANSDEEQSDLGLHCLPRPLGSLQFYSYYKHFMNHLQPND